MIDAVMLDMSAGSKSYEKIPEFRVSSFPYCPIRDLLYNKRADSAGMDFYTSIGTAVHETLQKWIAVGEHRDKIYSCWKIKETGEIIGPCMYNDIPKKYSNYTILYEEITIKYKGLSGHVDLVMELIPGMFVVIDFKTTNLQGKKRRYPSNWGSMYPASRSSIIQISTYSTLLREIFGINIVGWCLIYIDRGDKIQRRDDYHKVLKPWGKKKHASFLPFIDKACKNNARLQKLRKLLDKSTSYNTEAVEVLNRMVKNRPCTSQDEYDEWMRYKFHEGPGGKDDQGMKNKGCELLDSCIKGNKACRKAILAKL